MSFSLAQFPADVLAAITSRLTDYELLILLPSCGSSILTTKLIQGGITSLNYTFKELPWSLIKFMQKLSLRSFVIDSPNCNTEMITHLVRGLSPEITHFKLNHSRILQILETSELDREPLFLHSHNPLLPWNVSESFPKLATLHLTGPRGQALSKEGPNFQVRFLLGLPRSLTELKMRSLAVLKLPVDIWKLLPPFLTELSHIEHHLPSVNAPSTLMDSLLFLNLRISAPLEQMNLRLSARHNPSIEASSSTTEQQDTPFPAPTFNLTQLVFPSRLIRLTMQSEDLSSIQYIPEFPATLKMLNWTSGPIALTHPHVLLERIPRDIEILELAGFLFSPVVEPEGGFPIVMFPKVRRFIFRSRIQRARELDSLRTYTYLFQLLPSVTFLCVSFKGPSAVLGKEHLKLILNRSLHTLRAPLSAECFVSRPNEPSIKDILPFLHELRLLEPTPVMPSNAELPPLLAVLDCSSAITPAKAIMNAPRTTIVLGSGLQGPPEHSELFERFGSPAGLPQDLPDPEPTSSLLAINTSGASGTSMASEMVDSNSSDFFWKHSYSKLPTNYRYHMKFWCQTTPFGPTLTALDWAEINENSSREFNLHLLPHLTHLHLSGGIDYENLNLKDCHRLQTLHVHRISPTSIESFPPHLTSLVVRDDIHIHQNALPLPESLTDIRAGTTFQPLSCLSQLPNLRVFGVHTTEKTTKSYKSLIPQIPKSITKLCLSVPTDYKDLFESLNAHLENLKILDIGSEYIDRTFVSDFHRLMPDSVSCHVNNWTSTFYPLDTSSIASYHVPAYLEDTDSLGKICKHAVLRQVFPRLVLHSFNTSTRHPLPDQGTASMLLEVPSWTAAPILLPMGVKRFIIPSPDLKALKYSWPPFVEYLSLCDFSCELEDVMALPRDLKDLRLRKNQKSLSVDSVLALPRTLTRLELGSQDRINSDFLDALPSSLVYLGLEQKFRYGLSLELFQHLPPALKWFEGVLDPIRESEILDYALWKGITIVSRTNSDTINPLREHLLEPPPMAS